MMKALMPLHPSTTDLQIYLNKNPSAPLTGVLHYTSGEKIAQIVVYATTDSHQFKRVYPFPRESVDLPIIGFKFGKIYEVKALITFEDTSHTLEKVFILTTIEKPSDPNVFPKMTTYSDKEYMEPGWIMFNPRRQIPSQLTEKERLSIDDASLNYGLLIMIDEDGDVIWYYKCNSRLTYCTVKNNTIYYGTASNIIYEIDYFGNILASWCPTNRPNGNPVPPSATPVNAQTLHHQFLVLDNGNILALSTEQRLIDHFYTSEDNPLSPKGPQYVIGDVIIEFTRKGDIVWKWNAFDYLDLNRIGYETFVRYWGRRGYHPDARDWTHFNGLYASPNENTILVNSRIQSAVYKIDKSTGTILWIFGNPSGFSAKDQEKMFTLTNGEWPWQQHAPYINADGDLTLFNNDNYGALPFSTMSQPKDTNSRPVVYQIDEKEMTAQQIWDGTLASEEKVCSTAMGSLEPLKGTNVLINYGMLLDNHFISDITWNTREKYPTWTMIREMCMSTPPRVVFEMKLTSMKDSVVGWQSFGAVKIYEIPGKKRYWPI